MKLHFAEAGLREAPQTFEKRRMVLLAGKEKGVARRSTVGVAKFAGHLGIALLPRADPLGPYARARAVPEGLVVVAESKEQMARDGLTGGAVSRPTMSKVAREPEPEVLLANTSEAAQGEHSCVSPETPATPSGRARRRRWS